MFFFIYNRWLILLQDDSVYSVACCLNTMLLFLSTFKALKAVTFQITTDVSVLAIAAKFTKWL